MGCRHKEDFRGSLNKLLVVYNTCGISGVEHIPYYVDSLRSILCQNMPDMKIAISACCPSAMWCLQSENTFHDFVSYNYIEENLPVSVTFNDTVDKCVKHFGEFEGYFYVDSGISFWDPGGRWDAIKTMYDVFKSGPYAITAAMPSNDDGRQWWNIEYKVGEDYIFPIDRCTNMHCQIFSEEWRNQYRKILPDIFASHTMESVFSFMAAAIHRKFILTQKVHLLHSHSMDGASIGSRAVDADRINASDMFESGALLFKTKKTMDQRYREGVDLGFGWESCKPFWPCRPELYDSETGYAKDPKLKDFFRDEVYLKKHEFDYAQIKSRFIPGR